MKNSIKILAMMFLVMLTALSCSKGGDEDVVVSNSILGKWYSIQWKNAQETLSTCEKQSFIEFRADNSFTQVISDEGSGTCRLGTSRNGLWKFEGRFLVLNYANGLTYQVETYEITATKLTMHIIDNGELFIEIYEKR